MKTSYSNYMKASNRTELVICCLFLVAALLLMGDSALRVTEFRKMELVELEATIQEIETVRKNKRTSHYAYVSYTYDGVAYDQVRLGYWYSGMNVGDTVNVRIDPNLPGKVVTNPMQGLIISVIAVMVSLGCNISVLLRRYREKRKERQEY